MTTMEKQRIVFATANLNKLREVREIIGSAYNVVGLKDIACNDDIPETQPTLEGNSLQKAQWVKQNYGVDCFSDDTGLEVEALNGAPGVHSARYANGTHDMAANLDLLMRNMEGVTNRKARFRTVVTLLLGDECHQFEGIVNGHIALRRGGSEGFGYDPVFIPEGESRTFAEMTDEEKNAISHRGRAMRQLADFLKLHDKHS